MAKGHPIDLGHRLFPTKKADATHFKDMLARYSLGETVNAQDAADLTSLLHRHPEALQKRGPGIDRFSVNADGEYGTRCFWVERSDGSRTDFSYLTCISGEKPTLIQEFTQACRNAVFPSINRAKRRFFEDNADASGRVTCEITGDEITWDECHVDHKPPLTFQVIVETFLKAHAIEPTLAMITSPCDAQATTRFVDNAIADMFVDYHTRVARLRVLKSGANLGLAARNRICPPRNPIRL